ncbi:ABC transporter ATP-binding protein [Paenibacillus sp. P25]|nr:ABC transporter ATP-binding protein [Paenibacillus sp. P25]
MSFSVLERDFVGLIGANGAGKTTLLKMIVGLLRPTRGEIRLFGQPIRQFSDWERIGYVPQKNALNPLFPATVREVVTSGLYNRKMLFRRLTRADRQKADDALYAMRIEDLADRRIGQLSGGQQRRAFLARAMINNPEPLILDEPTVGIDAESQEGFFRMIRHMHQHHHITFMMVSHDMDMMKSYLGDQPLQKSGAYLFM